MANKFWESIKNDVKAIASGIKNAASTGSSGAGSSASAPAQTVQTTQPVAQNTTIRSYNSGIQGTKEYADKNYEAYKQQYNLARQAGLSDEQFLKDYGSGTRWLDMANNSSPAIRQYNSGVRGTREYAESHMDEYKAQYNLARQAGVSDDEFLNLYGSGTRWQDVSKPTITSYNSGVRGTKEYADAHMDEYKEQWQLARQAGLSDEQFLQAYCEGTRWRQEQSYLDIANSNEGKEPGIIDKATSLVNDSKLWNDMQDRRMKRWQERYGDATFADDFWGQTQANYGQAFLAQELNRVYNDLADNPDDVHDQQYVQQLEQMLERFQTRNTAALDDENVQASWISKHLAGYAPQLVTEVLPAAGAAALAAGVTLLTGGAAAPAVAAAWSAYRGSRLATSAINAYEVTRGASYSNLIRAGADANSARSAATDEAIISSAIEMGDTAFELFAKIPGLGRVFGKAGETAAAKTLSAAVKAYLKNIPQEGAEEFVQEVLSSANTQRILEGNGGSGWGGLIREFFRFSKQMFIDGEHADELAQAMEAAKGGAIIGAMMGGAHLVGGRIQQGVNNTQIANVLKRIEEDPSGLVHAKDSVLESYLEDAKREGPTKNENAAKLIQAELDKRNELRGSIVDEKGKPVYRYMTDEQKAVMKESLETMTREDITADKVDLFGLSILYDQCLASDADERIRNMLKEEALSRQAQAQQRQANEQAQQQGDANPPSNPVVTEETPAQTEAPVSPVAEEAAAAEAVEAEPVTETVSEQETAPVEAEAEERVSVEQQTEHLKTLSREDLLTALKAAESTRDFRTAQLIRNELQRRAAAPALDNNQNQQQRREAPFGKERPRPGESAQDVLLRAMRSEQSKEYTPQDERPGFRDDAYNREEGEYDGGLLDYDYTTIEEDSAEQYQSHTIDGKTVRVIQDNDTGLTKERFWGYEVKDNDGNRIAGAEFETEAGGFVMSVKDVVGGDLLVDAAKAVGFEDVIIVYGEFFRVANDGTVSPFRRNGTCITYYDSNGTLHSFLVVDVASRGTYIHEQEHQIETVAIGHSEAVRTLRDRLVADGTIIPPNHYEAAKNELLRSYRAYIAKRCSDTFSSRSYTEAEKRKLQAQLTEDIINKEISARLIAGQALYDKNGNLVVDFSPYTKAAVESHYFRGIISAFCEAKNYSEEDKNNLFRLFEYNVEYADFFNGGANAEETAFLFEQAQNYRKDVAVSDGESKSDTENGERNADGKRYSGRADSRRDDENRASGGGSLERNGTADQKRRAYLEWWNKRDGTRENDVFTEGESDDASGGSEQRSRWGKGLRQPSEEELATYQRPSREEVINFINSNENGREDAISGERFWEYMSRNRGNGKTLWDTMKGYYWQTYYLKNWQDQRSEIEGRQAETRRILKKWRTEGYDALSETEQEVVDRWQKIQPRRQELYQNVTSALQKFLKEGYSSLNEDELGFVNDEVIRYMEMNDPDLRAKLSKEQAFFSKTLTEEQDKQFREAAQKILDKRYGNRVARYNRERSGSTRVFDDPNESLEDYFASLGDVEDEAIPPEMEAPVDDDERFMPATPAEQRQRRREVHGKGGERPPIGEPPSQRPVPLEERWMGYTPRDVTAEERAAAAAADYEQREQRAYETAQERRDRIQFDYGKPEVAWNIFKAAADTAMRKFDFDKGKVEDLSPADKAKRKAMDGLRSVAQSVAEGKTTGYEFAKYVMDAQRNGVLGQYINDKTEGYMLGVMQNVVDAYEDAMETASPAAAGRYGHETQRAMQMLNTRMFRWDTADRNKATLGVEADKTVGADKRKSRRKARFNQSGETFGDTAANFLTRMQINPTNVFRGLFGGWNRYGGSLGYKFSELQDNATRVNQRIISEAQMAYLDVRKMKGFEKFATEKDVKSISLMGKNLNLSQQQVVGLYKTVRSLAADQRQNIREIQITDSKGKTQTISTGESITREMFKDMQRELWGNIDEVGKAYLEVTDNILEELGKQNADVEEKVYGVRPRTYEKGEYITIRYVTEGKSAANTDDTIQFRFTQERTRKASGTVLVEPVTRVIDRYINQSANHIAYTELGDELALMNRADTSGRTLSEILRENYGEQMGQWMNVYVEDMNNFNPKDNNDGVSTMLRKGRQAVQTGALVGSVSVPMKQISSYWAAAGKLRMETLRKAYRIKFVGAKTKGTQNPLLYYRKVGGIDPTMSEIMKSDGLWAKMKSHSKILQAMEKSIPAMDFRTIDNLYTACTMEVREDNPKLDVNSDKFMELVNEKFEDVVISTQPIFTRNARAEYARTNSEFIKMFSMFRTQQTQNLNRIMQAIGEARAAKGTIGEFAAKSELGETIKGQAASALSLSLLTVLADTVLHKLRKYKDEDDEIDPEKVMDRIGLNAIESASGTVWFADSALKFAIDTINKAQGKSSSEFYGVNMGIVSTISSAAESIANLVQNPTLSNLQYTAGYISQAMGIPLSNAYRMINAAVVWSRDVTGRIEGDPRPGEWDDILRYLDSEVVLHPWGDNLNHKVHVMVNAELKGNTSRAEDIQNDLYGSDKVDSAIRSEAKNRYLEGAITKDQSENLLVKYTGMEAEDIQKKNDFWEFLKDNPKYQDSDRYPGVSESLVQHWNNEGKPSGIPVNQFYEYMRHASGVHSIDVDGDGNANGKGDITKQSQIIEYINGLNLTKEQKDALWLAFGYKTTSKAYKSRPWK